MFRSVKIACVIAVSSIFLACATDPNFSSAIDSHNRGDLDASRKFIEQASTNDPQNKKILREKEQIYQDLLLEEIDSYGNLGKYDFALKEESFSKQSEYLGILNQLDKDRHSNFYEAFKKRRNNNRQHHREVENIKASLMESISKGEHTRAFNIINDNKSLLSVDGYLNEAFMAAKNDPNFIKTINALLSEYKYHEAIMLSREYTETFSEGNLHKETINAASKSIAGKATLLNERKRFGLAYWLYLYGDSIGADLGKVGYLANISEKIAYNFYIDIEGGQDVSIQGIKNGMIAGINQSVKAKLSKNLDKSDFYIYIKFGKANNRLVKYNSKPFESEYVSGYGKRYNQTYHDTLYQLEDANRRMRVARILASDPYGSPMLVAAVIEAIRGQIIQLQNVLNSDAIYDTYPEYSSYQCLMVQVEIERQVAMSYNVIDSKTRKVIYQSSKFESKLEGYTLYKGVHDKDRWLNPTSPSGIKKQKEQLDDYLEQIIHGIGVSVGTKIENDYYIDMASKGDLVFIDRKIYQSILFAKGTDRYFGKNVNVNAIFKAIMKFDDFSDSGITRHNIQGLKELAFRIAKTVDLPNTNTATHETTRLSANKLESSIMKTVRIISIEHNTISGGSGFFGSPDGYIVTNYHVIDKNELLIVKDYFEKLFIAKVVAIDRGSDLALIKISSTNRPFFNLKRFSNIKVGQTIFTVGAPHGYDQTVSKGIVSGKRILSVPGAGKTKVRQIQIDALVTHGNSGGPLIDDRGNVIGVNTWTENIDGKAGALNFAISSDEIIERLNPKNKYFRIGQN